MLYDACEKGICVGKHSIENRTAEVQDRGHQVQEAKELHLADGRRISAAEREMLFQTLTSRRRKLLTQAAELALRLSDLVAETERLDRQLDDIERSEFWRTWRN
jgi:uncharacterized protein involved in exopolysaccharide biosynthesis